MGADLVRCRRARGAARLEANRATENAMMYWMIAAALALTWVSPPQQRLDQEQPAEPGQVGATQPASRPGEPQSTFRKPDQARILEELLRRRESPRPIRPAQPGGVQASEADASTADKPLLLEGTPLVERPGRFMVADERPLFVFHPDDSSRAPQTMEILKNQFLEIMEDEAKVGVSEFVISADVTSYRGQNYLLIHKVLRRVPNRNLSP
jgi:hypothetical protein